jgi:TonB family protein
VWWIVGAVKGPLTLSLIISVGLHLAAFTYTGLSDLMGGQADGSPSYEVSLRRPAGPAGAGGPDGHRHEEGSGEAPPVPLDTDDPRYRTYFGIIKGMIARVWAVPGKVPESGTPEKVVLEFSLAPDGSLREVRIAETSGDGALDRAVVDAVETAAPFPPPPGFIRRSPFVISALFVYDR